MLSQRLSVALEEDAFRLPDDGRIAVFAPSRNADLSALPKDRLVVVSRHYPEYQEFLSRGYEVQVTPDGSYALSILCLPRAKAEARAALAALLPITDGPVAIDGQKTDGVESMLKDLRRLGEVGAVVSKAHGKLFTYEGDCPPEWSAQAKSVARPAGGTYSTAPGVFSADGIDPGSAALAEALPGDLKGHVVDLGAGWGFLSDRILQSPKVTQVDLVEADHAALEAARANITDERASFHWNDALTFASSQVDHVVTNPPFHTSRNADPALGQAFIKAAARLLKPKGQLWLVANRHLPYERTLDQAFGVVNVLAETKGFKVKLARNPRNSRKG